MEDERRLTDQDILKAMGLVSSIAHETLMIVAHLVTSASDADALGPERSKAIAAAMRRTAKRFEEDTLALEIPPVQLPPTLVALATVLEKRSEP